MGGPYSHPRRVCWYFLLLPLATFTALGRRRHRPCCCFVRSGDDAGGGGVWLVFGGNVAVVGEAVTSVVETRRNIGAAEK